ncbi:MAG: YbaK/EbsC family protein [Alphaproteobacteria bacterium]
MDQLFKGNIQIVKDALSHKGLNCKILDLPTSTRTAEEAASTIGCTVSEIAKSLIFKTKNSGRPILVLVSGQNRVNEKTLESHIGEEIRKADADFAKEITGFSIGGIAPIGHKEKIEIVFVDEDLFNFDNVWVAAGTSNAVFNIKINDLLSITNGQKIKIT